MTEIMKTSERYVIQHLYVFYFHEAHIPDKDDVDLLNSEINKI